MQITLATDELNELFRGVTWTRPTQWYVGLDLNASGTTYSEPTYTGYARQGIARSTSAWTDPTGVGYVTSTAAVNFPAPPGGYTAAEIVNRYFLVSLSAPGGGELVFDFGSVQPLTLVASAVPRLTAGSIYVGQ